MAQSNHWRSCVTPNRVLVFILCVSVPASVALLLDEPVLNGAAKEWFGTETFKLLLQFLLVTVIGGGVFAYITARRADLSRDETQIADLQALVRELGDARRAMKRSRRNMRAKLKRERDGFRIARSDFENALKEVLDAQINVEEVREHIAVRKDIVGTKVGKKIDGVLYYAARYLHDVYEDYEKGRVGRDGNSFVVNDASKNLVDFLANNAIPDETRSQNEDTLDARFQKLEDIEAVRRTSGGRRYARVTTECFRVVVAQLGEIITARLGMTSRAP